MDILNCLCLLVILGFVHPHSNHTISMSPEKRLIKMLLERYRYVGDQGRPVLDLSTAVPVKFGLGLIQMALDEKKEMLTLNTWTRYTWKDEYLRWDPQEYGNVTQIRINPEHVWIPDIMLYNTPMQSSTDKNAGMDLANRPALLLVKHTGIASWYPNTIIHVSCSVDVTRFPFDHQMCSCWFGSWTYSSQELNLDMAIPGGIDMSSFEELYEPSCSWDIYNVTSNRKVLPDETSNPSFVVLTFDLYMRRKMVFSSYILTLPCFFLACLTLVVFCLPPERPDRISLAMSLFSSFLVLLLILVETANPTASSVPIIGLYYCFNMVLIIGTVVLSSLVVNISRGFGDCNQAPRLLDLLVGRCMGSLMLLHRQRPRPPREASFQLRDIAGSTNDESVRMLNGRYTEVTNSESHSSLPNSKIGKMLNCLFCGCHQRSSEVSAQEQAFISRQWSYLAKVLDRFFLVVYIVLICTSLAKWFPWPSQERDPMINP